MGLPTIDYRLDDALRSLQSMTRVAVQRQSIPPPAVQAATFCLPTYLTFLHKNS